MRFPGQRIAEHYFPVTRKATSVAASAESLAQRRYLVGLDHVMVDIEVQGEVKGARELGLLPGESVLLDEATFGRLFQRIREQGLRHRYVAGGTVGNTLNNFTHLSGEPAVLLGAMPATLSPGSAAFAYVAQTPRAVDLGHVQPVPGRIGSAITIVSDDGERSFAFAPGISSAYAEEHLPIDVVQSASIALASSYCLRPEGQPIAKAALRMMQVASRAGVTVAFGLGSSIVARELRGELRELLAAYVNVAAMNAREAEALTGESDVLLAAQKVLEWVDVAIITEGAQGLTLAGYTDERVRRETSKTVRSKSIAQYNRWEYSRLLRRADCEKPLKIYSHTHPYRGGPERLMNTSGAGDAVLAALLHDIAANAYHRQAVPDSDKHASEVPYLTYSSLSRNAQYGNRVAYEVLQAREPRLTGPVGSDEADGEG